LTKLHIYPYDHIYGFEQLTGIITYHTTTSFMSKQCRDFDCII